eukprot:6184103-Pleurochrysis_carterae.AAC.3
MGVSNAHEIDEVEGSANGGEAAAKRRRGSSFGILINFCSAFKDVSAEAKKLRSELMGVWKANASLTLVRDCFASDIRSAGRRIERLEVVASRAAELHREAEESTGAKSQQSQTMSSYRTSLNNSDKEKRVRAAPRRLDQSDSAAAAAQSRLDHAKVDLADAANKSAALALDLQTARAQITKLKSEVGAAKAETEAAKIAAKSEVDDAKLMYQTATEQLADDAAERNRLVAKHAKDIEALQRR